MNVSFFITFQMQLSWHKSSFHDTYRLRRWASIKFFITDFNNQSLIDRALSQQKTKTKKRKKTKDKKQKKQKMRSICYLLPISLIIWTTLFKMLTLSYLKAICPLFQLWKTTPKHTADWEAFLKIARRAIKDKVN